MISPYSNPNKWYEIGNPISIGSGKELISTHGSTYYVIGTDINGCEVRSENYFTPCLTNITESDSEISFDIIPNPTSGLLNIIINSIDNEKCSLVVYDMFGKEIIFKSNLNHGHKIVISLDLRNYVDGMYLIKLYNLKYKNSN